MAKGKTRPAKESGPTVQRKSPEQIVRDAGLFVLPYGPFQGRKVLTVPRAYLKELVEDRELGKDLRTHYKSLYSVIKEWLESKKDEPDISGEPLTEVHKPKVVSHYEVHKEETEVVPGMRVVGKEDEK